MAEVNTGVDAVGIYLTGAASAGDPQRSHALSLGGEVSSTRVGMLYHRFNAIRGVRIDHVCGLNGVGVGSLGAVDSGSLAWQAPGSAQAGAAVAIADGETKALYDGEDSDAYIVVTRTSSLSLIGAESVQIMDSVNNVVGGSNFSSAEAAAGAEKHRAVAFRNNGASGVTNLLVWIDADANLDVQIGGEAEPIEQVADEDTAPAASLSAPTSEGTAANLGSLAAGESVGLWIERSVDVGETYDARVLTHLHYRFTFGGENYYGDMRGISRVANASAAVYELFVGEGAMPDLSGAPDETFTSWPYDSTLVLTDDTTNYIVVRKRNQYGLVLEIVEAKVIYVDGDGEEQGRPPAGPMMVKLTPISGGKIRIEAGYFPNADGETTGEVATYRADQWAVYVSADGDDADPGTDTPALSNMSDFPVGPEYLTHETAAYLEGTPVSVLVRTRRDGIESENTELYADEAEWWGPAIVDPVASLGKDLGVHIEPSAGPDGEVVWIDQGNNIYWELYPGETRLWADTQLVWNMRRDSGGLDDDALFTEFELVNGTVSAAGSAAAVEVVSWTGGDKRLSLNVNGVRLLMIDVTNLTITVASVDQFTAISETRANVPVWRKYAATCLQVWDRTTEQYETAASLESTGELRLGDLDWRQEYSEAACLGS